MLDSFNVSHFACNDESEAIQFIKERLHSGSKSICKLILIQEIDNNIEEI